MLSRSPSWESALCMQWRSWFFTERMMSVTNELKQTLLHQSVLNDNVLLLDFFYRYTNINLNLKDTVIISNRIHN